MDELGQDEFSARHGLDAIPEFCKVVLTDLLATIHASKLQIDLHNARGVAQVTSIFPELFGRTGKITVPRVGPLSCFGESLDDRNLGLGSYHFRPWWIR